MTGFDWQAFLTSALQTSFAVSALVLLVLIIRQPVAKIFGARAAYTLWALPLIRLVLPPLPQQWAPLAKFWPDTQGEAQGTAIAPLAEPTATAYPAIPLPEAGLFKDSIGQGGFVMNGDITPVLAIDWSFIALSIWAIGTIVVIGATMLRQQRFTKNILKKSVPTSADISSMTTNLQQELAIKRDVAIIQTTGVRNPMVTGLIRPVIILPTDFAENFSEQEQLASLTHELTHIKRGDLWALLMAQIFLALQWLNPLAHHGLKLFRTDQEAACDADLLHQGSHSAHAYGATLVKAVKLAQPADRPTFRGWNSDRFSPLAPALSLNHGVKERLTRMQSPAPCKALRVTGISMIALLGAGVLAATANASGNSSGSNQTLTLDHGTLHYDGVKLEDRRFVLLSDPFAALHPKLAELHEMDVEFEMPEIPEMPALPEPPEPPTGAWSEAKMDAFEAEMDEFERHVETAMEGYETQIDAIEQQVEIKAAAMQSRAEDVITDEFSDNIDEAGNLIESLADQCRDYEFDDDERVILTATPSYAEKQVRALCLKGGKKALYSPETEQFIRHSTKICSSEKDQFFTSRDQTMTFGEYTHD